MSELEQPSTIGQLLSRKEVAALFNVGIGTVDGWIQRGRLDYLKLGHTVKIPSEAISCRIGRKERQV